MNKRQKKKCRHKMAVMKAGKTLYIDEFHLAYKLPTVDNVVLVLKDMGEESLAEHLKDCHDAMKNAGYKIHEVDITAPPVLVNPYDGMFDVLGDEKKIFVEKLGELFELAIIEEDETHIRIVYTERNFIHRSHDETLKMYHDFEMLLKSMKNRVEMVPVQTELTMGTPVSPLGINLEQMASVKLNPFTCDKETMLGCKRGEGKSFHSQQEE